MKARFFCDHCGREVGAGAARCPGCGRFFSAVKCPRCAFQGGAELFADGCPACGYLFDGKPAERRRAATARKHNPESSLSFRAFRLLTALLVLLLVVFLVMLVVQPFNR